MIGLEETPMTILEFLTSHWRDYSPKHRHPANLAIHIVSGLVAMIVSVAAQGAGHRFEPERLVGIPLPSPLAVEPADRSRRAWTPQP